MKCLKAVLIHRRLMLSLHISSSMLLRVRHTLFCDVGMFLKLDNTSDGMEYYGLKRRRLELSSGFVVDS
jgi:hypothetical protein